MQLSKIEIKGFKSFGEQATVLFDTGVTGIVGPNGCGKSNVVDAIRWVLGEQKTRSLRSDKMENIIFNGTNKRKPAQTAQVALTFHNDRNLLPSEYTHVTITRRYHRSGDSEYLINDVRCRLKDINDLFLDTGIGPDSYAIIELKKVDEILNDKYQYRRELFEKAAGISKYKTRKKESLSRLESVDKDLSRVGDLLFEIEKNLKSLERQAKQAERYFKLKNAYQTASLAFARRSVSRQQKIHEELKQQIQTETERRKNLQETWLQKENQVEQQKEKLEHFEKNLVLKQKQLQAHTSQIRQLDNEQKLKNEKVHFLKEKNENIRQQIAQDIEGQRQIREEIQKLNEEKEKSEAHFQQLSQAIAQLQTTNEQQKNYTAEIQNQLKSQEAIYQQKQQQIYQLHQSYEVKQTRLSSSKQEMEKIIQNNNQLKADFANYEAEQEKISEELAQAKQELADFQEKELRKAEEVQALETTIELLREDLNEANRQLDARQNEYNLTKSLVDNMEGFPEALKFLQSDTDWAENIPLVSDIISCESQYRVAIENFLDPWLNYYVVQTEAEANQAIHLLKKAEKGKANFFVLDWLEAQNGENANPQTHLSEDSSLFWGGINPQNLKANANPNQPVNALDIVHYEKEHAALVHYLLDELYVIPSPEKKPTHAEAQQSWVTLNGEVIQRKFSLTGGSVGSFEGKRIGRAKNLERLSQEIQSLSEQINEFKEELSFRQANLQSLKQNKSLKEAYQRASQKVQTVSEKYVSLRSKKEQLHQIIDQNLSRHEEIQYNISELAEEVQNVQPQLKQEQEALLERQERIDHFKYQYEEASEQLAQTSADFNERNLQFYQQKNKLENAVQQIEYQNQSLEVLKGRIEKHELELKQAEEDLENLLTHQENYDEQIQELNSQTSDYQLNVDAAEKDFYSLRAQITNLEKESKEYQRRKESQDTLLQGLQNKAYETNLSLNRLQERLSVEFQVDLEQLMAQPEISEKDDESDEMVDLSEEELKHKADILKQKMEKIGTINPMAMEAYQEMKERYDFISQQKEDLTASKQSLLQTIEEMEDYARQAFMAAYEQIRTNFTRVFRSLFSAEDKADLVLSDPENPLESKIDIVAQPKGKRPLTIDQLSGGEKTLTSISLLFALYLLKPAPFCIFDEVDAPLDDANTDKFNRIIKEFSKDSQFILVTHNKRTMANTDIMYGVTMMEEGVSSVVPVDLRQVEMQAMGR